MLQIVGLFFSLSHFLTETTTEFRHKKKMWWKSVTLFRHKLWRIGNNPSQIVTESDGFRHNFVTDITHSVTKNLPRANSSSGNCDGLSVTISVTNFFLWRKKSVIISVTKFLWRNISVTNFPSQFPSQIVTDPSQINLWRMKLWRSDFRHKLNFSVTILKLFRHNFRHNTNKRRSIVRDDQLRLLNISKTCHHFLAREVLCGETYHRCVTRRVEKVKPNIITQPEFKINYWGSVNLINMIQFWLKVNTLWPFSFDFLTQK